MNEKNIKVIEFASQFAGRILGNFFFSERSLALLIFAGHIEAALAYSIIRSIFQK